MKWIGIILLKALAYIISHFVWPVAFICRGWARKYVDISFYAWFLWLFLNDESDYGEEYWLRDKGLKPSFWSAVRWSLWRNNSFNLNYQYLRASMVGITLPPEYKFRWEQLIDGQWVSDWTFNVGQRLDESKSRIGSEFFRWKAPNGKKYWRFTLAKITKYLLITIKSGWNQRGEPYLDVKLKRNKSKYIEHWTNTKY